MQFFRRALHLFIRSRVFFIALALCWTLASTQAAKTQADPLCSTHTLRLMGTEADAFNYRARKAVYLREGVSVCRIKSSLLVDPGDLFAINSAIRFPNELNSLGQTGDAEVHQSAHASTPKESSSV